MINTYFTDFYKKIYNILINNRGITGSSKALVTVSQSNLNRANQYLDQINDSKWAESGASIFKNNIVSKVKQNMKDLNNFIANNLDAACKIAINNLLPKLIEMKDQDEILGNKRTELETARNNLSYQEQHMPSKPYKDKKGVWRGEPEYNNALNEIGRLQTIVNNLIIEIQNLINVLNGIKVAIDTYIMQISVLGSENIIIPGFSLPSDISQENLAPLEQSTNDYSNLMNMSENSYFDESTGIYYEMFSNRDIRVVLPDGRSFIQYSQYAGRKAVKLSDSNHTPVCGPCAYASALSFFGLSMFSPESVGRSVGQFSSFSFLNKLINGLKNIRGSDGVKYSLESSSVGGEQAKTLMMNPVQNKELDAYIRKQAEAKGMTYKEVAPQAKRSYLEEKITQTLEQGGVVSVRTSQSANRNALSFTKGGHFIDIMGIDKNGNLIISNSSAATLSTCNDGKALESFTKKVEIGGVKWLIPEVTLDQFINNNIMGCKGSGNSITCITGIRAAPIIIQADAGSES